MTNCIEYLIPLVCCSSVLTCISGYFCYRDREQIIESCNQSCYTCYNMTLSKLSNNNFLPISPIIDKQNDNTG